MNRGTTRIAVEPFLGRAGSPINANFLATLPLNFNSPEYTRIVSITGL
jgi:hypothetical protein